MEGKGDGAFTTSRADMVLGKIVGFVDSCRDGILEILLDFLTGLKEGVVLGVVVGGIDWSVVGNDECVIVGSPEG